MDLAEWGWARVGGSAKSGFSAGRMYTWSGSTYTLTLSDFHLSQLTWEPPESPKWDLEKSLVSSLQLLEICFLLLVESQTSDLVSIASPWAQLCVLHGPDAHPTAASASFHPPLEEEGSRV